MDRVCAVSVVDEAYHCLGILAHHESRTWCDAIIPDEPGLSEVGIDLLLEGFDINFVVVDAGTTVVEVDVPWMRSVRDGWVQHVCRCTYLYGFLIGGIGRGY